MLTQEYVNSVIGEKLEPGPSSTKSSQTRLSRDALLDLHCDLSFKARALMAKKNADYTNDASDPFANFKVPEALGLCSAGTGLLTRMLDKVKRLVTFEKAGIFMLKEESLLDTTLDLINYAILNYALNCERKRSSTASATDSALGPGDTTVKATADIERGQLVVEDGPPREPVPLGEKSQSLG